MSAKDELMTGATVRMGGITAPGMIKAISLHGHGLGTRHRTFPIPATITPGARAQTYELADGRCLLLVYDGDKIVDAAISDAP